MKWGFIGYGRIAKKFEESISASSEDEIVAIASRSGFNEIPSHIRAYDNYNDILLDENVDIIYVNTTHNSHKKHTINALQAGKHVLCEKPMSINQNDVREMTEVAARENRFLMEAIWSRYLPGYEAVIDRIRNGEIGKVEFIQANFCFKMDPTAPKERLTNPALAGGAVWDVGIYPIMLAQDIFIDDPTVIQAIATLNEHGVEERALISLSYSDKRLAQLCCSYNMSMPNHAIIIGSEGKVIMDDFWKCEKYLIQKGETKEVIDAPMTSTGLYHEMVACKKHIADGLIQSPKITWADSIQLAGIMDEVIALCRK